MIDLLKHPFSLLTEFLHALLAGNGLARTLAGAGVAAGALTADGERSAMAIAAIAADVAQPRDILRHRAAEAAFDEIIAIDDADDLGQFFFRQFLGAALEINLQFAKDRPAVGPADAEQIGQADPDWLIRWNIHARNTRHNRFLRSSTSPAATSMQPAASRAFNLAFACVWCWCRSPARSLFGG